MCMEATRSDESVINKEVVTRTSSANAIIADNKEAMKKEVNRGAWTEEEDQKLADAIQIYGPKRWKTVATKAGLNRCGKSCRLRWMNYLRPNIKRGNISDQEEDLILRLHKLLGNRWSLIAGRLPGRTDNEIKNYWNSHLSKKLHKEDVGTDDKSAKEGSCRNRKKRRLAKEIKEEALIREENSCCSGDSKVCLDKEDDFFDFSNEDPITLEWIGKFISELE